MPIEMLYLIGLFAFVFIYFIFTKRPIYEAMLIGFILLLTVTGTWGNVLKYVDGALSTSLVYAIVAFIALSQLLTHTGVIDSCINIILACLGRIPGGAGYVSLIASTFMGSLSGSGPGNVMATGVITIPAMKRSGFPAALAANVESASSTLGNMIPPSGIIVATFGAFQALYPDSPVTIGQFWIVLWGISIWFIVQRLITLFAFCKYYHVKPMEKSELPKFKDTVKKGWKALFLPIIILVPFILDSKFNSTFFTDLLGKTGAKSLSSCVLLFIAGFAAIYTVIISKDKKKVTPKAIADRFEKGLSSLVPTVATVIFAYMIGELFTDLNVGASIGTFFTGLQMSRIAIVFIIPLFTTFLGMVFPGSSQIAMFGAMLISVLAGSGVNPVLAAAILPCICGSMSGITPPVAVCMFAAMGIAESDYMDTTKNCFIWVILQYVLSVVILLGWLPIIGL